MEILLAGSEGQTLHLTSQAFLRYNSTPEEQVHSLSQLLAGSDGQTLPFQCFDGEKPTAIFIGRGSYYPVNYHDISDTTKVVDEE